MPTEAMGGPPLNPFTVQIYLGRKGLQVRKQWRWRVVARNGRVLAHSGEGYTNRQDLYGALLLLRDFLPNAPHVHLDDPNPQGRG